MRRRVLWGVAALLCLAAPVGATSGGERVCDILGWDAAAKRVYVHERTFDGAGGFGDVFFVECDGASFGRMHTIGWGRRGEQDGDDPGLNRQLDSLRAKLRPMVPVVAAGLPWRSVVITRDTLPGDLYQAPHFQVRASFGNNDFIVSTFFNPSVFRKAVYDIPGRDEKLVLLSYTGQPHEGGYETQSVVLAPPGRGEPIVVSGRRDDD